MEFEWDEAKRLKVLEKHGFDFRRVADVFAAGVITLPAREDGEVRALAVGSLDGVLVAVCYTMRGAACRVITVRRARD